MTHLCPDCICYRTEVRIPGEPHIPANLEAEPNPKCPVHFPKSPGRNTASGSTAHKGNSTQMEQTS